MDENTIDKIDANDLLEGSIGISKSLLSKLPIFGDLIAGYDAYYLISLKSPNMKPPAWASVSAYSPSPFLQV